jgi:hypothetical protein
VQYGGNWNVEFVEQPDGLVILEAPIGSHYSVQVLDEAAKRHPGVKVKAVVTTSDAWPHLGGIREYAARGIPIYALDLNVSILTRVINAPHTFAPDSLSARPKAPAFRAVAARTTIGTGDTRIEIIPRGETRADDARVFSRAEAATRATKAARRRVLHAGVPGRGPRCHPARAPGR